MKIKEIVLFSLLSAGSFLAGAQSPKKEVMPISPEAAALNKVVGYPVNFSTGAPDISVPLYTVESGDLKLPIKLNYHPGGFKINEQSTSVGLGWSLSSDIQISRSINGLDDFDRDIGYLANTDLRTYYQDSGCSECNYPFYTTYMTERLASGSFDGAPDKFNYRLINKTGSFYFVKNNTGTGYFIMPVPYDNITIQYTDNRFIITDTDGTVYYFGSGGQFDPNNPSQQGLELSGQKGINGTWSDPYTSHITTWKCKQIVNATKTENLNFNYTAKPDMVYKRNAEKIEYYSNPGPCTLGGVGNLNNQVSPGISSYSNLIANYAFYNLSSPKYMLTYPEGAVFYLPYLTYTGSTYQVNNRTFSTTSSDFPLAPPVTVSALALEKITFRGGEISFNGTDQMFSISIYNSMAGQTSRVIELKNSYVSEISMDYPKRANGGNFKGTLYLDSINIKVNGVSFEKYGFLYNQKTCFGNHLRGSDAWGYPNLSTSSGRGGVESTTMVPYSSITQRFYNYIGISNCNDYRDNVIFNIGNNNNSLEMPNEIAMKKGILERIIYPSGGFTDFDYEPNLYQEFGNDNYGSGPILLMAGGLRLRSINNYDGKILKVQSQKYYRYGESEDGVGIIVNPPPRNFINGIKSYAPFSYDQNIVYIKNSNSPQCNTKGCMSVWTQERKTTYQPASTLDYNYMNGAPVFYTKVTEYNSDMGEVSGKKVYTYYPPGYYDPSSGYRPTMVPGTNVQLLYAEGLLGPQKSTAEYLYNKSSSTYQLIHSKESSYTRYKRREQARVAYAYYNNVYQVTGGNVSPSTNFYDQNAQWSSGPINLNADFVLGTYGLFSGRLFLTAETEKWQTPTGIRSQSTQYTYKNLDGGNILPYLQPSTIVTTSSKGEQYTKNIKYAYDFPGVTVYDQMTAANMISQPVSEVSFNNTLNKEISRALTNFGSVSLTTPAGSTVMSYLPVSLQRSEQGSTLETEVSFLYNEKGRIRQITDKTGNTTVYLWGYNYCYPIAEFSGATFAEVSAVVNETALQSITDQALLRTALGSLRAQLAGAMVTISTYSPLVGVSSQTDPKGLDKFYDYDPFGRLLTVKDRSQKILSRYEYNYRPLNLNASNLAGQNYTNIPLMATFKKNCPSSTNIQIYNYVIPGGVTYGSSTAQATLNMESSLLYGGANAVSTADCIDPNQISVISVHTTMVPQQAVPSEIYLDLIGENGITGSCKFPYSLAVAGSPYVPPNDLYTRSGTYKLSFRQTAISGGVIIKYYITPSNGAPGYWVKNGDTITFSPGVNYAIDANNIFF